MIKKEKVDIMKKLLVLFIISCFAFVAFIGEASADIAVGPLTKTIQVPPEGAQTVEYKVSNAGKEPITVNISARTWFTLPENKDIKISDWLDLGAQSVRLSPGEIEKLKFKVKVPKNAKGELAAMIYFAPERGEKQTLGTSYGVSLYVFVKGTERVKPEINNVTVQKKDGEFYLTVTIENDGNVHIRPVVKASIKAPGDIKEVIELPFGKPIFGGGKHTFFTKLKSKLPEQGNCEADITCEYGKGEEAVLNKSFNIDLAAVKEE